VVAVQFVAAVPTVLGAVAHPASLLQEERFLGWRQCGGFAALLCGSGSTNPDPFLFWCGSGSFKFDFKKIKFKILPTLNFSL